MMTRIPQIKSYGLKYLESIRRMILSLKLILRRFSSCSEKSIKRNHEIRLYMESIEKDVREFFFKWEVWQGRTKNPQKQTYNNYIETTHPKKRYQMDLVQWSDYLWESEEKELLNEE